MNPKITLKEPERCDYLYIDDNNKVHLLLPIVGGEEVGLDNTCQTTVELRTFFFGNKYHSEARKSASDQLTEYKEQLEEDIKALTSQKGISRHAYKDLIREKKERVKQIGEYIELIKILKEEYDENKELDIMQRNPMPPLPSGLTELIQSSTNAGAVRLSPVTPDLATSFKTPLFSVMRNYETSDHPLTEGLGFRLRTTLVPSDGTPTIINKQTPKDKIVEAVLAKVKADHMKGDNPAEKLEELKKLIQEEYAKIDPDLSVNITRDGQDLKMDYLEYILAVDENDPIEVWIGSIIDATVEPSALNAAQTDEATSLFYDDKKEIKSRDDADKMSIKVQYLLGEANFYCKTNKLSDANFGQFFDKEPHATQLAESVQKGLTQGSNIESIIYNYINAHHGELGLKAPLTSNQQHNITDKFNQHFGTIKDSPHFDEFLMADTDKPGNIFSHQGRMSCHFLDFFTRQTKGKVPLGNLAGHSDALQQRSSNRLNHKNEIVAQGYNNLEQFKLDVVKLLAENKPKELLDYLVAKSPTGIPNYSMLSLETQNYISYNHNWPAVAAELKKADDLPPHVKDDLTTLLSRENVSHENLSAIAWSKHSSKPLLEVELNKVADGLLLTVEVYNEKRAKQSWYKGSKNEARDDQCQRLQEVANDINTLLQNKSLSKSQVLEKLLTSIDTLDKIDKEISAESFNFFQSSLQKEIKLFQAKLQDMCELENFAFKSNDLHEIISFEQEEQFKSIQNSAVREIVRNLPSHCHTTESIEFFNTLNPQEAAKVASYLSLEYKEINSSIDKTTLFEQDIPQLFKEVNIQLLSKLKDDKVIDEQVYEKLSNVADQIPPEQFTRKNIEHWAVTIEKTAEVNPSELLDSAQRVQESSSGRYSNYRSSMEEIRGDTQEVGASQNLGI